MITDHFDPWRVINVSEWREVLSEPRGIRTKSWVRAPDGQEWLRKEPRQSRPYEPAIESSVLRLSQVCGIDAPESHVCEWEDNEGWRRGLVVKKFVDLSNEELHSGSVYLRRQDPDYYVHDRTLHTFNFVIETLHNLERDHPISVLLLPFIRMICFDAWIGNSDRHQENWSIVSLGGNGMLRLAPLYDPAACLGVELQDNHRLLTVTQDRLSLIDTYIAKCPSGFGNQKRLISMSELVEQAQLTEIWQNHFENWLTIFSQAMIQAIDYMNTLPDDWLPQPRKDLALALLSRRLIWLQERI